LDNAETWPWPHGARVPRPTRAAESDVGHFSSGQPTGVRVRIPHHSKMCGLYNRPLLLPLADYASFVEAVSLHGHQSGRRPVIDRKDCFHVQCALHGCITTQLHAQFPGGRKQCPFRPRPVAPKALAPCRSAAAWGCWWERIRRASSRVSKSRKIGGSSYGKLASCRPALPGALVATVL
jgi:hypothetical protein